MLLLYFKNLSKSNLMLFCHIQPENHFLMLLPSPDDPEVSGGILLYLVFSTRCKRYSVQLEIAPNETNFDNPRQVQIKKNSNFT